MTWYDTLKVKYFYHKYYILYLIAFNKYLRFEANRCKPNPNANPFHIDKHVLSYTFKRHVMHFAANRIGYVMVC